MRKRIVRTMLAAGMAAMFASCGSSGEDGAPVPTNPTSASLPQSPAIPEFVTAALADPERAMHAGADARRKPAELIALSGLKPGDRVLDLIPGDGYWTRIFSRIVGPDGRVLAVWPQNYARYSEGNVATLRQLAATSHYANVRVEVQPNPVLSASGPLDLVWTSQNYHDYPDEFMGRIDPAQLNRAVYAMLRPGGIFFIIDHAAEPGSGMRDTEALHRIDPETVRQQVEAAGFEYLGASAILANPADDHRRRVFDPAIRGRTDQFVMKFRRPT